MKVCIIDNYDSFTHNLVHQVEKILEASVTIYQHDAVPMESLNQFDKLILSPGPGLPSEAGMLMEVIKQYHTTKPLLGVCLGLQGITEFFGGRLLNLEKVHHGIATKINVLSPGILFKHCPTQFKVGRYHSWVAHSENFPASLQVTATAIDNTIMAIEHKELPIYGVQFHPESILSEYGDAIMRNFLFANV